MPHPHTGAAHPRPPDSGRDPLFADLTPEQTEAVRRGCGPLLIIAGPGPGKTRTLTHRVAHLLVSGQATPQEILAVTSSVRAAGELWLRLADLLGEQPARGVLAATFHSVCARLLRAHAGLYGRTEAYTIYDQGDMRRVLESLQADARRQEVQAALARRGQPPVAELEAQMTLAKNRLLTPGAYAAGSRYPAAELVAALWRAAERELEACNAWSFDDLLVFAVRLLREHALRLAHVRGRWRWLLVDEMQDTNEAQATLVHLLAGAAGNVAVVGDDDQAIYRFRSAEPRNILGFAERYPQHRRIVLTRNFRSRAELLAAAATCIAHNVRRASKDLVAVRGAGGRITTRAYARSCDEGGWVAALIADALATGTPPADVLVLARTAYATGPVQAALAAAGIPHRVLGSLGL